jgi:hypothetical protein
MRINQRDASLAPRAITDERIRWLIFLKDLPWQMRMLGTLPMARPVRELSVPNAIGK